jgi:putative ABC transport system substrate-binding protein
MKPREFIAGMTRRAFIAGACAAAVAPAWPAYAQQTMMPVIGWLSPRQPHTETEANILTAFRQGLAKAGTVEGRNVTFEFRFAEGHYERLPTLAEELVKRRVAVIVTAAGVQSAQAAVGATTTIPIVFASASDPVRDGLVTRINRPGGNATGAYLINNNLMPKRLELLHQLVPKAGMIGFLVNPTGVTATQQVREAQAAATALGLRLAVLNASRADEIDAAFASLGRQGAGALLMGSDTFFQVQQDQLIALAARYKIPAIYEWPEFVKAGGLITYAVDRDEIWRQLGVYVTRILNGAKPGDLPIIQPTKFLLIVNLKTANALGMKMEEAFLRLADEVIE